jgi:hypothetical protein
MLLIVLLILIMPLNYYYSLVKVHGLTLILSFLVIFLVYTYMESTITYRCEHL